MLENYISENADMQTMLFRNSLMVEAFGDILKGEEKVKCVQTFDDELKKLILRRPYSEQMEKLVFLYVAGVLERDVFTNLAVHNNSDFLSDVISAENYLLESEGRSEEDILPVSLVSKLLLMCANSKKIENLSPIDFKAAAQLISKPHITLTEHGFIHCDRELTLFLHSLGEPFGIYDISANENLMQTEAQGDFIVQAANSEDYETNPGEKPLAMNYVNLEAFLSVYDEVYGRDFIRFAFKNNVSVRSNFRQSYENYLQEIKLKFCFNAYSRKQHICGDRINAFDYKSLNVSNNMLVSAPLNNDNAYSKDIFIEPSEYAEESELMKMALRRYQNCRQLYDDMVLEVIHCNEKFLFVNRGGSLIPIDNDDFHRELFDFNKIWSIIQKCSREKKITKTGNEIKIPSEYMSEIPAEQHVYVINMVKEQYKMSIARQRSNPVMHTMIDIRAQASESLEKFRRQRAEEAAQKKAEKELLKQNALEGRNKNKPITDENGGN